MRLYDITVGNFKNIAETTIRLDGITALAAVNNYGKSNVLEAINFGFNFINASPKQRQIMMSWKQGIPLSNSLAGKDFIFGIEFENPDSDVYKFVKYFFSFSWINDQKTGLKITNESLECRSNTSVQYTSYIKRSESLFRPSKRQTNWRKIPFDNDILSLDVIPLLEDIEIAEVIQSIKSLVYNRCDKLDLKNSFLPQPIEFVYPDAQSAVFDEADIPKTLSVMKEHMPEKYQLFEDIIFDLYPDFETMNIVSIDVNQLYNYKVDGKIVSATGDTETIPFRIKDEVYQLLIKSRYLNQPISIERMSTGTQRIFWLVANAIITGMNHAILMGVDEVETSIHPKLMKNLMSSINDCLEKGSLILTSHSPYLIQYLKPESIYIGVPTDDGTALFKSIKKSKIKEVKSIAKKLEISFGEYIFSLLSGGEDDAKILRSILED